MDIYNEQSQNTEEPLEQDPLPTFAKTTDLFRYCFHLKRPATQIMFKNA